MPLYSRIGYRRVNKIAVFVVVTHKFEKRIDSFQLNVTFRFCGIGIGDYMTVL